MRQVRARAAQCNGVRPCRCRRRYCCCCVVACPPLPSLTDGRDSMRNPRSRLRCPSLACPASPPHQRRPGAPSAIAAADGDVHSRWRAARTVSSCRRRAAPRAAEATEPASHWHYWADGVAGLRLAVPKPAIWFAFWSAQAPGPATAGAYPGRAAAGRLPLPLPPLPSRRYFVIFADVSARQGLVTALKTSVANLSAPLSFLLPPLRPHM
eukprot:363145-Chlamydomonas_euryale.AAC.13